MIFGDHTVFFSRLRHSLLNPLPGVEAQDRMAIVGRSVFSDVPSKARQAAVCAVIYPGEQDLLKVVFIRRAANQNDRHSGQISFPGGQYERQDANLMETALRELSEETGIKAGKEQVLGKLTTLFIPVSNFLVHPYVVGLDEKPAVLKQVSEVDELFGYKLETLLSAEIKFKKITGHNFVVKNAPYFDLGGKTLWGATAMMTNELLEVIRSIES